jgi:D-beta-D-heptose 7-phosphate kinase/D-beta-D-heptose 1-phosphate adenosyltransferase
MNDLLKRFGATKVAVVGDLMLDEYVWGDVDRISPEAPVPVVRVRERTHIPGGAANAAAGVVALGGTAQLIGIIGDDEAGRTLLAALEARGIGRDGIVSSNERATTTKTRVIAHNQQVVRTDVEELEPPDHGLDEQLTGAVAHAAGESSALVVSDYGKGAVSRRVAAAAISSSPGPVIVDPKGGDYAKYRGATVITPNVHELELATRVQVVGDDTLVEAAALLRAQLDGTAVLVTRGASGMSLFADGTRVDIPAVAHSVYDVTGAGDTVVAVLATALGAGVELEDAARLANRAAGIVVGKVGTATVELTELD